MCDLTGTGRFILIYLNIYNAHLNKSDIYIKASTHILTNI